MSKGLGETKEAKEPIFRALTASADVPSSVTETADTTSAHLMSGCRLESVTGLGKTREAKEPNLQSSHCIS
ncbi:hypothetical protein Tco_1326022 [Tanacetum coccineum]